MRPTRARRVQVAGRVQYACVDGTPTVSADQRPPGWGALLTAPRFPAMPSGSGDHVALTHCASFEPRLSSLTVGAAVVVTWQCLFERVIVASQGGSRGERERDSASDFSLGLG